jgi:hypothetical protein
VLAVLQCAKDHPLRTSPFVDAPRMRSAVWIEPRLHAEISYAEVVEGRLRAPSYVVRYLGIDQACAKKNIPGLPL